MKVVARMALVLVTAAVLERAVFSQLRIDGAAADVLLLVAISAGIVGGSDRGAVVGFFAGLTIDLLVQSPLGLYALVYCLTGYLVGVAHGSFVRSSPWEPPALAALASILGITMFVVASFMLGRSGLVNRHLLVVMGVVAAVNVLLITPANRILNWALGAPSGSRVAVR
jgi:rod shape-determining protein MreD